MSIKNNTTSLQNLLEMVNSLPEAGSGGIDTSDATATAAEIFEGETAYTATGKVAGTFTIQEELTEQADLISQIASIVATKTNPGGGSGGVSTETFTVVNNMPAGLYIGGNYIPPNSSAALPTSTNNTPYITCLIEESVALPSVTLNGALSVAGRVQSLLMNGKIETTLNGSTIITSGYHIWFLTFRSVIKAGDIMDFN